VSKKGAIRWITPLVEHQMPEIRKSVSGLWDQLIENRKLILGNAGFNLDESGKRGAESGARPKGLKLGEP
jgi:hypothetical protein